MRKIRVLAVDDSAVVRRMLTEILSGDPEIEFAGVAPNGRVALAKLPQLAPDVVTLDLEMPELDGIETLRELRKTHPDLPVIMFSALTERGAAATLEALSLGATDYATKPASASDLAAGMQSVREQLLPKIKVHAAKEATSAPVLHRRSIPSDRVAETSARKNFAAKRKDVLVIGSSTGGPQALATLFAGLPADFPLPIVVVQHMPPVFTRHLAERLNQVGPLTVAEAKGGETLRAGHALVAPGDWHIEVARQGTAYVTVLSQGTPENSCRPAVDVLFRSAAKAFGPACLGVVLTGMGRDGLRGAEEIASQGGTLIAQDEATSVVWGMPRAVTEAGLATPLPLNAIPEALSLQAAFGRTERTARTRS